MISQTSLRHGSSSSGFQRPFRPHTAESEFIQNVSRQERLISIAAGAVLAYWAFKRPSFFRTLAAFAGSSLLSRGLTGICPVYRACGVSTAGPGPVNASSPEAHPAAEAANFQGPARAQVELGDRKPAAGKTETQPAGSPQGTIAKPRSAELAASAREVAQQPRFDVVEEASEESFPASDAPGYTRRSRE